MKFDGHIGSTAAEVPVKFQSDRTILNANLAASRLYEILRKNVFSDIETEPSLPHELTHWPLGDLDSILKVLFLNLVLLIGIFRSSFDNALRWMSWDLTEDKSTLVQVMAWCRQATTYYLSQCWPRSVSPCGVTGAQWDLFMWFICGLCSGDCCGPPE